MLQSTKKDHNLLSDLDLEPIIIKAMDSEEGHGWTFDFACRVAQEYRKFLMLCLTYSDEPIVPSKLVDDFWHLHILDTQKYMDDCDRFLGYMLHHFPYFGMRGDEDAHNLNNAWQKTLEFYSSIFGESAPSDLWLASNRCPNCGRRCRRSNMRSPQSVNHTVFDERRPRLVDMGLSL